MSCGCKAGDVEDNSGRVDCSAFRFHWPSSCFNWKPLTGKSHMNLQDWLSGSVPDTIDFDQWVTKVPFQVAHLGPAD